MNQNKTISGLNILLFAFALLITACSEDKKEAPPIKNPVKVELIRLESQLFSFQNREETKAFMLANPAFTKLYLDQKESLLDERLVDFVYDFYRNPALKEFNRYTDSSFHDMDKLKADFADLFSRIQLEFPEFKVPKIYTVVTGFRFDKDIAFSDTAIVISIDYFLGNKAPFRPNHYEYFLKRYDKPYILPMVGLALSTKYNVVEESDKTMLANMIYYGKAHYFLERVMPNLPDSLNIMYTEKELNNAKDNLTTIWGHFVERKLLYETSHKAIESYTGEAPATNEISKECPGRIGRWLGWEIVSMYMEKHPAVRLKQLMADPQAEKIFKESGYRPEKQK
jgi:gliding motility-associated lipoprotein GldB